MDFRRLKTKSAPVIAILVSLAIPLAGLAVSEQNNNARFLLQPVNEVDPFIGTDAHGHTYPGASVPFGMVQLSPDTRQDTWDGCAGYHYSDSSILGFSHTHLSGTGCADLGDVLFIPTTAPIDTNTDYEHKKFKNTFSHKDETASPGYYSVKLDGGIKAELTATKHAGIHRYTFPNTNGAKIIIDLTHAISDKPIELNLNIVDDQTVTGMRRSEGWAKNQWVFFAAKFSKPFNKFGTVSGSDKPVEGAKMAQGKQAACWLNFDASDGKPILAKVALSSVSADSALKNLQAEVPAWDFDGASKSAREAWNTELSKIKISTADEGKAKTFYTALYRCLLAPTVVSDVDGSYRGSDFAVHQANGFENYSTFSLWDTFRAEHPLMTIIQPARVSDFIKSFQAQADYHEKKLLPIWTLASNETYCMIGYHSFPVIAEAYLKGLRDWDAEALFKQMVANSQRNDWWADKGYLPADKEQEAVSKTLEFAYDDWCLAQFAKALGHQSEFEKYSKRAEAYKNIFDKQTGFMRGKLQDGTWRTPFDPTSVNWKEGSRDFTEANSWQYSFFVPQNVPALIDLYGGPAKFMDKLDQLFKTPVTKKLEDEDISGLIGQYAQGNEPCHNFAYLYSYAGSPAKTAEHVKEIRDTFYNSSPAGLCGNEDCGQMSAWYIFSALGFYPVNPVSGNYVIGTPAFEKASIQLPGGKTFNVSAPRLSDRRIYVAKASLNGKPLNRVFITHNEVVNGGTLELTMTDKPGDWGTTKEAAPL